MRELEARRREPQRRVRDGADAVVLLVGVARVEADDAADLEAVDRGDGKRGVADGGGGGYFGDGEALGSEGESGRPIYEGEET